MSYLHQLTKGLTGIGRDIEPYLLSWQPVLEPLIDSLSNVTALNLRHPPFTTVAPLAFTVSACIFFGSKAVSPIIFADAFQGRIKYKNKPVLSTEAKDAEFHTSMVSALFPSFIIPVFALPAVMLSDDSLKTHMTAAAPRASYIALGVSLGYMAFDLSVLLLKSKSCIATMKPTMYKMMLAHHIGSLVAWPYAICTGRCALFVNWFMLSEGTNIFLNARYILMKIGHSTGTLYLSNGLIWTLSFVVLRMAPIPYLMHRLLMSDWSKLTVFESTLALFLVPVPMILNCYWFTLICDGLRQMAFPPPPKQKPEDESK